MFEKNGFQQIQMESCQPIKRLKDKKILPTLVTVHCNLIFSSLVCLALHIDLILRVSSSKPFIHFNPSPIHATILAHFVLSNIKFKGNPFD
jgi:hypothetical protein